MVRHGQQLLRRKAPFGAVDKIAGTDGGFDDGWPADGGSSLQGFGFGADFLRDGGRNPGTRMAFLLVERKALRSPFPGSPRRAATRMMVGTATSEAMVASPAISLSRKMSAMAFFFDNRHRKKPVAMVFADGPLGPSEAQRFQSHFACLEHERKLEVGGSDDGKSSFHGVGSKKQFACPRRKDKLNRCERKECPLTLVCWGCENEGEQKGNSSCEAKILECQTGEVYIIQRYISSNKLNCSFDG